MLCNIGKKFVLKRVHVAKLHINRLRPLIDEFDLCFGQQNLTEKNIEQMTVSTLPEYWLFDFATLYLDENKSGFANNKNRIKKKTNEAEFEATHI